MLEGTSPETTEVRVRIAREHESKENLEGSPPEDQGLMMMKRRVKQTELWQHSTRSYLGYDSTWVSHKRALLGIPLSSPLAGECAL